MNQDEIKSLIIKVLLMVLTPLAAKFHADSNTLPAFASDIADAIVLGYGTYDHWNMAKVPENSMVTVPGATTPVIATAVPK